MTAQQVATGRDDFEAFYRARLPELVVLAHALAGPDDAWDVAQQVLLTAARRWRHVGELARPDVWAWDVCAAAATSRWARRLRSGTGAAVVLDVPADAERFWEQVRSLPAPEARARAVALLLDPDPDAEPNLSPGPDPDRGAAAAAALREAARWLDVELGLADLAARRRRRRVRTAAAGVAALALVASGIALTGGTGDTADDDTPVDPLGSRAVVLTLGGPGASGRVLLQRDGTRTVLRTLPDGTPLVEPDDLEVSPEGNRLAVVGDDTLQVVGLGPDRTSTSVPCRRCRYVDWMGFKVGILLVTAFGADGPVSHVYGNDGRDRGAITMPDGVIPSGYSPDRLHMVGVEDLGRGDRQRSRLFVLDDTTGVRTPLPATETAPGRFIYDVSWSPDGVQVAWIDAGEYTGGGVAAQDYRLMAASSDGSGVREVADLGRCYCVSMADPRFAWSPDGSSLVAVTVTTKDSRDASQVRVLSLDGGVEDVTEGGAPVDWGPMAP